MIALCAVPNSAIAPWMATLVVARELLVTSLRGLVEGQGGDFSAKQLGKWKMVGQCGAIVSVLIELQYATAPVWLHWTSIALVWLAIILTVLSGMEYVMLVLKKSQ